MENNQNHENMQEDIAFIRSMIHKTQKVIDPGAYFFLLWGVILIIGNGILPLIAIDAIQFYWLVAAPVGIILSIGINRYICISDAHTRFTRLSQQIGLLWATFGGGAVLLLILSAFFPDRIDMLHLGLLTYALMAMTLFAVGIIYLREYYIAGVIVLCTALLAYFNPVIGMVALAGFVAGGANIVLGTLALIRLKRG